MNILRLIFAAEDDEVAQLFTALCIGDEMRANDLLHVGVAKHRSTVGFHSKHSSETNLSATTLRSKDIKGLSQACGSGSVPAMLYLRHVTEASQKAMD